MSRCDSVWSITYGSPGSWLASWRHSPLPGIEARVAAARLRASPRALAPGLHGLALEADEDAFAAVLDRRQPGARSESAARSTSSSSSPLTSGTAASKRVKPTCAITSRSRCTFTTRLDAAHRPFGRGQLHDAGVEQSPPDSSSPISSGGEQRLDLRRLRMPCAGGVTPDWRRSTSSHTSASLKPSRAADDLRLSSLPSRRRPQYSATWRKSSHTRSTAAFTRVAGFGNGDDRQRLREVGVRRGPDQQPIGLGLAVPAATRLTGAVARATAAGRCRSRAARPRASWPPTAP